MYYQKRTDGTEPPSPESQRGGTELIDNPGRYFIQEETANIKFQIVDITNNPTLVWGPVVYVQYIGKPSLRIAQIDDEITQGPNSFGTWNKWENNNNWVAHPDETIFRPTNSSDWYLKASQNFKDPDHNIFRKYNVWSNNLGDNYFVNHAKISVGPNTSTVLAHFKQANDVTIYKSIDNIAAVNQGSFVFKNPWIVDDNSDSKGSRNRGAGTIDLPLLPYEVNFSTSANITNSSIHKGVFLDQSGPANNWEPPYYLLNAEKIQNATLYNTGVLSGRSHKMYFQNWSALSTNADLRYPNDLETPVAFNTNDAHIGAIYKGTQVTNTWFNGNNGQRTFVEQTNYDENNQLKGYLHNVYCSMGKIWYERSTDRGTTWELMNDGKPINLSENAKSPSAYIYDGLIYIVFQASGDWWPLSEDGIHITVYYAGNPSTSSALGYYSEVVPNFSYANDYRPVIAAELEAGTVVYDMPASSSEGLRGFRFHINTSYPNYGYMNKIENLVFPTGAVNQYSAYPSISKDHTYTHLVYEQNQTEIRYIRLGNNNYYSVSGGSSTLFNMKPVISVLGYDAGQILVSWIGGTYSYGGIVSTRVMNRVGVITYNPPPTYIDIVTWKSINGTNGNIQSVSNASNTLPIQKSLITFSYLSGNTLFSRWQRRDIVRERENYTTPASMSFNSSQINGVWSQAASDQEFIRPTALVFNSSSQPYYFIPSTTNFVGNINTTDAGTTWNGMSNVYLGKITEEDTIITFGRSGVASINDVEFVFEIGDILVGDSVIRFIEIPDTLVYNSVNELNQHTRTNNFTLTPNTNFYFSNIYYVVQKSDPDTALLSTDAVNFKAELVNAATNQVVGTFDNITYNKNNVEKYASIDYSVDCSGITAGEYYLRLVTSVNGNANYTLANIFNENTTLAKKNYNQINFTGSEIPTTYDLAQNFPNPFNPSTTIRFQIPQDGIVTLKIYDILGAEVATLVNEQKVAGKYEENFNASTLSSGVYIYKIQAGDFISSKKMILLK